MERLLTTEEVAELMRTTVGTLHYWRSVPTRAPDGFPLGAKFGSKVLWRESEINAYVANRFESA
jgi:predicted DNA-binding transcriptional regulator AlpA